MIQELPSLSCNRPQTALMDAGIAASAVLEDKNIIMAYESTNPHSSNHDAQYKAIALLPIPSAILSVFGSLAIIHMAWQKCGGGRKKNDGGGTRQQGAKWTPYNRLLVGMSATDVLFSLHLAVSNFMRPSETSPRVWAFGNAATCAASGYLAQLLHATSFYSAALSFYFVLATRYGMKQEVIARRVEPWMHIISIGFPLITSTVGAIVGVYSEPIIGLGCWVYDFPRGKSYLLSLAFCCKAVSISFLILAAIGCGTGTGQTGKRCASDLFAIAFGAVPSAFWYLSLVVNNLLIYLYVRKLTSTKHMTGGGSSTSMRLRYDAQVSEHAHNRTMGPTVVMRVNPAGQTVLHTAGRVDDGAAPATSSINTPEEAHYIASEQLRRLRLVQSQSLLFVLGFFGTYIWGSLLLLATGTTKGEAATQTNLFFDFFWLQVLQAIFLPLQGFFNLLIYARPKYLQIRRHFPRESRWWACRRCIRGESVTPRHGLSPMEGGEETHGNDQQGSSPKPSEPDELAPSDRQQYPSPQLSISQSQSRKSAVNSRNVRLAMSSLTASTDHFPSLASDTDITPTDIAPTDTVEGQKGRWHKSQGDLSSSIPITPVTRTNSNEFYLKNAALDAISELSDTTFIRPPDTNSKNQHLNLSSLTVSTGDLWRSSGPTVSTSATRTKSNERVLEDAALDVVSEITEWTSIGSSPSQRSRLTRLLVEGESDILSSNQQDTAIESQLDEAETILTESLWPPAPSVEEERWAGSPKTPTQRKKKVSSAGLLPPVFGEDAGSVADKPMRTPLRKKSPAPTNINHDGLLETETETLSSLSNGCRDGILRPPRRISSTDDDASEIIDLGVPIS